MANPRSVVELSDAQLAAYNRQDIDAFCACFSDDVLVFDEAGKVTMSGIGVFRERYGALFAKWPSMGASVVARIHLEPHVVEHETYFRKDLAGVVQESGEVIVRYTRKVAEGGDARIALVEFLRQA